MKKIILLLVSVFAATAAFAKNNEVVVKGVVLDSLTREGEPAAVIEFYEMADTDKAVAFTTTDMDGHFSHSFTLKGDYCLRFNNLGRKVIKRCFTIAD